VIFGVDAEWTRKHRQNLSDIHVCIVAMQARVVSETAYCDWSDELDGNGASESAMGKSLGSDVVG
jgi:hypothetical protein